MSSASHHLRKSGRAWERRALDRVRDQALQRGHKIVEAARQLVIEGGIESVTLRAVLEKTGFARRSFYGHFQSMDDVMLALFEDTMTTAASSFRERIKKSANPLVALEEIVRTMASAAVVPSDRAYMVAMSQQHVRLAERRPEDLSAALAPMNDLLAEVLRAGMEKKLVRDADALAVAEIIHSLIATEVHRNLYRDSESEDWIEVLWEFIACAIGRAPSKRGASPRAQRSPKLVTAKRP